MATCVTRPVLGLPKNSRSPALHRRQSAASMRVPVVACCDASRISIMPLARYETLAKPEQSSVLDEVPPQRYGVPSIEYAMSSITSALKSCVAQSSMGVKAEASHHPERPSGSVTCTRPRIFLSREPSTMSPHTRSVTTSRTPDTLASR